MNRKVIKSILNKKIKDWVNSIEDEKVRNAVEKNTVVTGGAIASLLLNEEVKDFDIYFTNKETTKLVSEYYVKQFNERVKNRKNKFGFKTEAFVLDGDYEILLCDQVFDREIVGGVRDLRAAFITVALDHFMQFLTDHLLEALRIGEDLQVAGNLDELFLVLLDQLLMLKTGQAVQA